MLVQRTQPLATARPTNFTSACAKAGRVDRALTLYDVAKHKKLPLDSYFYAAIIEGKYDIMMVV